MDTTPKKIYINGFFFAHLQAARQVGDRPEFYRHHELGLWTIYQVLKAGGNRAVITDDTNFLGKEITTETEFKDWVANTYPGFENQLDDKIYTKYPHPSDKIP